LHHGRLFWKCQVANHGQEEELKVQGACVCVCVCVFVDVVHDGEKQTLHIKLLALAIGHFF
jgi:hypothetical protein